MKVTIEVKKVTRWTGKTTILQKKGQARPSAWFLLTVKVGDGAPVNVATPTLEELLYGDVEMHLEGDVHYHASSFVRPLKDVIHGEHCLPFRMEIASL